MSLSLQFLLAFAALGAVIAVFITMAKCGFFKSLLFSFTTGAGLLLTMHFLSLMSGVSASVNALTLGVSTLGGIPGVVSLLLFQFFA